MDPVHAQVLDAARSLTDASKRWRFRVRDVVRALPHLNPGTVRTHVASRCCVNAPSNHQSRHPYFRALGNGEYALQPAFRRSDIVREGQAPWPDRWFAERGTGVDATQIIENLKLTPTERLERMRRFALSLDELRRGAHHR